MRRRTIGKGQEAAQKRELLFAEPRDISEALGASQNRQQRQQQHFIEPINYLAGLARIRQVPEIIQKNRRLAKRSKARHSLPHHRSPPVDSVDHDRFSTSPVCHVLLHPITLRADAMSLYWMSVY